MDKTTNDNKEVRKKLYIKLYYSMLDWEWYDDTNTFRVFMHLMLTANRTDHKFHGQTIHRGEALASVSHIATALNLSTKNVRTALKHLERTNEVAIRKIANISVIRLNNYYKYQSGGKPNGNSVANWRQNGGNRVATLKDCNIDKNDILKEYVSQTHTKNKANKNTTPSYNIELALKRALEIDPTKTKKH